MLRLILKSIIFGLFLTTSFLMASTECQAQWNFCQDTTLINPFFPCVQGYEPVCACNGITYRNECFARQKDGIIGQVVNGVCGEFAFDIVPNPPIQNSNILELGIYLSNPGNVEIFVIDVYGVNAYRKTLRSVQYLQKEFIDTRNFERGVYIVMVVVGNKFQTDRFTVVK